MEYVDRKAQIALFFAFLGVNVANDEGQVSDLFVDLDKSDCRIGAGEIWSVEGVE
jgi:hypothetical protein